MYDLKREISILWLAVAVITGMLLADSAPSAAGITGEAAFKEHCAACHADGGNVIRADKTLSRADREKHGIKTAMDIVMLMRKPGEGMTLFDRETISDQEAEAIADYIMETF